MIAKQKKIRAKLPLIPANITTGAHSYNKQNAVTFKVIDKKTEKTIVHCVVSSGNAKSSSVVYADLWVSCIKDNKIPKKGLYIQKSELDIGTVKFNRTYNINYLSGKGSAGGGGYDKVSQAIQNSIEDCGISLYGTPYPSRPEVDFKKLCCIGGTGEHESALLAIAYACGYNNVILVRA
jgi:hypothetical protein